MIKLLRVKINHSPLRRSLRLFFSALSVFYRNINRLSGRAGQVALFDFLLIGMAMVRTALTNNFSSIQYFSIRTVNVNE